MKTLNLKVIGLLLALATTQVLAQRFTTIEPDSVYTGWGGPGGSSGYYPHQMQAAVLGEKNSIYANLMLLGGKDTLLVTGQSRVGAYNIVNSRGFFFGTVCPFSEQNVFTTATNETVNDNVVSAVAVLDSLSDSKKTATVIFASLQKLVVMKITINNINGIDFSILKSINMPEAMWQANGAYGTDAYLARRLTLLGTSQSGSNKIYHFATGNPFSKSGSNLKSGRVDFFSIIENSWSFSQSNRDGLTDGRNGLFLGENARFGTDLAVIDNFDKKNNKALAVLLPASTQHPNSAIYIFPMSSDWTPSTGEPEIIAENFMHWVEEPSLIQDCRGLGTANWEDGESHLLVSCNKKYPNNSKAKGISIKDLILDSSGNIKESSIFFTDSAEGKTNIPFEYQSRSNPLDIKNHKNNLRAISLAILGPYYYSLASFKIFSVMDADYSKNFSIAANSQEAIVNIDSLFYKNWTTGFSVKTLFGSAKCEIQGTNLTCLGSEKTIGSWSGIELSNSNNCNPYKVCKIKDTIFVYVRSATEPPNTALRVPKKLLVPYFGSVNLGNIKTLSYFKNPDLQNTSISWNSAGLKLSVLANTPEKGLSITPFSQNEGIDTLVFDLSFPLSISKYPVYLHIADTSKILSGAIPANPGKDTIWNIAQKKYIALPRSSSKGDIYTYDIAQDSLGIYAEIIDDYLHILKIDIADIFLAYTENGQIKHRKITLMPEPKATTPIKTAILQAQSLNAMRIGGGLQINGLNGEFELRAYNFKGEEIQREKANIKGSVFVKLKQYGPQIVQIRSGSEKISIFTLLQQPEW